MKPSTFAPLLAVALGVSPLLAIAADPVPDLKGTWIGTSDNIVVGKLLHHPDGTGTFAKPMLGTKDIVQVVTGQDGRRFWGVRTLSSPGQKTSEPFIGFLSGKGNQKVVMVDTDGYFNGELTDDDTVELCYAHTGGKTGSVASCFELKRSR